MNLVQFRAHCKELIQDNPSKTEEIQTIFAQVSDAITKGNQEEEVVEQGIEELGTLISQEQVPPPIDLTEDTDKDEDEDDVEKDVNNSGGNGESDSSSSN